MLPAHPQMTGDLIITLSDYERRETCPRAAKRFDGFRDRRPPWQVRTHIQARISTLQCWLICMHAHAGACTHTRTHARTQGGTKGRWRPGSLRVPSKSQNHTCTCPVHPYANVRVHVLIFRHVEYRGLHSYGLYSYGSIWLWPGWAGSDSR